MLLQLKSKCFDLAISAKTYKMQGEFSLQFSDSFTHQTISLDSLHIQGNSSQIISSIFQNPRTLTLTNPTWIPVESPQSEVKNSYRVYGSTINGESSLQILPQVFIASNSASYISATSLFICNHLLT